jgi:low affinity Fe/Cu permease
MPSARGARGRHPRRYADAGAGRVGRDAGPPQGADVMGSRAWYSRFAKAAAHWCARPRVFVLALGVIVVWIVSGPLFGYSDTWQLVINTGTTIVTFLMVFLIQNTQTRDTEAIQIKLDELIRAMHGAHNALLDLEELDEEALGQFKRRYLQLATDAREELRRGRTDTNSPDA